MTVDRRQFIAATTAAAIGAGVGARPPRAAYRSRAAAGHAPGRRFPRRRRGRRRHVRSLDGAPSAAARRPGDRRGRLRPGQFAPDLGRRDTRRALVVRRPTPRAPVDTLGERRDPQVDRMGRARPGTAPPTGVLPDRRPHPPRAVGTVHRDHAQPVERAGGALRGVDARRGGLPLAVDPLQAARGSHCTSRRPGSSGRAAR